jgi:hypothetical protein
VRFICDQAGLMERLFRGMKKRVHMLSNRVGFLLRGLYLRQPALLDHNQCGFEASRQCWRANRAIQRLPTLRQFRIVDRSARRKLLGFRDQRFGVGKRLMLHLPSGDSCVRLVDKTEQVGIVVTLRLIAQ